MNDIAFHLAEHHFRDLFVEVLGWEHASGSCEIEVDDRQYRFDTIAHKRGFQVFHCVADELTLKNRRRLRTLHKKVSTRAHENIVIYSYNVPPRQVWQWAIRLEDGHRCRHREHPFFSASPPEKLLERLRGLRFTLDEEGEVGLVDALERVRQALDTTPELNLFVNRPWYAEKGDRLARQMKHGGRSEFDQFIEFHRPLVTWVVKPLNRSFRMDIEDLEQIGIQGLIHAARRFDPDRGIQFATYATYCIRGYCKRYAPAAKHLIRIPGHMFWPCVKVRGKIHRLASCGPDAVVRYVARLDEKEPDLSQQWRLFQRVANWKSLSDRKEPEFRQARFLIDSTMDPPHAAIQNEIVETVRSCIDRLHQRSAKIIRLRYGIEEQELTLEQVARILGITRERVRQIQASAEERLERLLRLEMPAVTDGVPIECDDAVEEPIQVQPRPAAL